MYLLPFLELYCPELSWALTVARAVRFAVVVDSPVDHVIPPPDAICAKLGCPPCASPLNPVQLINAGLVG